MWLECWSTLPPYQHWLRMLIDEELVQCPPTSAISKPCCRRDDCHTMSIRVISSFHQLAVVAVMSVSIIAVCVPSMTTRVQHWILIAQSTLQCVYTENCLTLHAHIVMPSYMECIVLSVKYNVHAQHFKTWCNVRDECWLLYMLTHNRLYTLFFWL